MDGSITCKSFASLLTTIHLLRNAPTHSMLSVTVLNPNVNFGCSRIQASYWVLYTLRLTLGIIYGFDRQKLILRRNLRWFLFLTSDGRLYSYLRWEAVSSWPGSTDSGPHEPSWPDCRRTFYIYIANVVCGEIGAWVGTLSHWVPDAVGTVTYDFPPSVWISPLITIMWRRRHFSSVVINGWRFCVFVLTCSMVRRLCTWLLKRAT